MKILIVDDDPEDKFLLHNALARCGAQQVSETSSVEDAKKFLTGEAPYQLRKLPDLIFLDVKMAGQDGFDFIRWMRLEPAFRDIPIIVLSGSIMKEQKAEALALGARAVYEKPQEHSKLIELVRNVLRQFATSA